MRTRHAVLLSLLLLVPGSALADTGFSTILTGAAEVPPNASTGSGNATVTLNTAQTQISWTVSYSGLVGTVTASHIHKAAIGVNGPVIIGFTPVTGTTSGSFSGSAAVTPAQVADLVAGLYYINVHTNVFPGGELRGQLSADVTPAARSTWGRIKKLYR